MFLFQRKDKRTAAQKLRKVSQSSDTSEDELEETSHQQNRLEYIKKYLDEHPVQNNYFAKTKASVEQARQFFAESRRKINKQLEYAKNFFCKGKLIEENLEAWEKECTKFLCAVDRTEVFVFNMPEKKKK